MYTINVTEPLERTVMKVLGFHIGKEQGTKKPAFIRDVKAMGFRIDERVLRATVQSLRKQGAEQEKVLKAAAFERWGARQFRLEL